MRKLISLGLFALLISLFTSQVFASNVDACDEEKLTNGLHGLCVAWHNANERNDEKNKAKFAAKYKEISGGDEVPGSEPQSNFTCPCFADLSFSQVAALGCPTQKPQFLYSDEGEELPINDKGEELPITGNVIYASTGLYEFFSVLIYHDDFGLLTHGGCLYAGQYSPFDPYPVTYPGLDLEDAKICMEELLGISQIYYDEELCPSTP